MRWNQMQDTREIKGVIKSSAKNSLRRIKSNYENSGTTLYELVCINIYLIERNFKKSEIKCFYYHALWWRERKKEKQIMKF